MLAWRQDNFLHVIFLKRYYGSHSQAPLKPSVLQWSIWGTERMNVRFRSISQAAVQSKFPIQSLLFSLWRTNHLAEEVSGRSISGYNPNMVFCSLPQSPLGGQHCKMWLTWFIFLLSYWVSRADHSVTYIGYKPKSMLNCWWKYKQAKSEWVHSTWLTKQIIFVFKQSP